VTADEPVSLSVEIGSVFELMSSPDPLIVINR